jgi:hypothetical protein
VEKFLLAALREQRAASPQRRQAWVARVAVGALAAELILAAMLALRKPEVPRPFKEIGAAAAAASARGLKAPAPVYRAVRRPSVRTQALHGEKPRDTRRPSR